MKMLHKKATKRCKATEGSGAHSLTSSHQRSLIWIAFGFDGSGSSYQRRRIFGCFSRCFSRSTNRLLKELIFIFINPLESIRIWTPGCEESVARSVHSRGCRPRSAIGKKRAQAVHTPGDSPMLRACWPGCQVSSSHLFRRCPA